MLTISNQLEGAYQGQNVTLECQTEAYPVSINFWTTDRGDMIISGEMGSLLIINYLLSATRVQLIGSHSLLN